MRRVLSQNQVRSSARYDPGSKLLYLDNPKVASSTIVYSMWRAVDMRDGTSFSENFDRTKQRDKRSPLVIDLFKPPYFGSEEMRKAVVFSVVRNPFARILSAYLHKIRPPAASAQSQKTSPHGGPTWVKFARRYRLKRSVKKDLSFLDFLTLVAEESDDLLDRHFAPQYVNLLLPFSAPQFVGRIEAMDEVAKFLADFNVPIEYQAPHATGANKHILEAYTPECLEIVRTKFADDFRLFGYSTELEDIDDFGPMAIEKQSKDLVLDWIATKARPAEQLDPAPKMMLDFELADERWAKLDLVKQAVAIDDNWKRLTKYAQFALVEDEVELCKAIMDKIVALRSSHLSRIQKPELFTQQWRPEHL